MLVFRQIMLTLNLLLAFVFVVDYFVIDSPKAKPRTKARLGVLLGVMFFAFLSLLLAYGILGALLKQDLRYLALLVYVLIPFVIGRFVSFRTLGFYASLQLLAFLLSAATLWCFP